MMAISVDIELEIVRQGIDDRNADTVQTTRHLVRVGIEFPAGVKDCHDHFRRRLALAFVHIHGNATTIIGHRDALVAMDGDENFLAIARQSFVNGIVDDFEHHVMQPGSVIGVTDIHPRTFAHSFQSLQDLDAAGVVIAVGFSHRINPKVRNKHLILARLSCLRRRNMALFHVKHSSVFQDARNQLSTQKGEETLDTESLNFRCQG